MIKQNKVPVPAKYNKPNRTDAITFFFLYHSGQSKFLTVWSSGIVSHSVTYTLREFLKLPDGYKFSISGKEYVITQSGIHS